MLFFLLLKVAVIVCVYSVAQSGFVFEPGKVGVLDLYCQMVPHGGAVIMDLTALVF